jgi:hypothetical protein
MKITFYKNNLINKEYEVSIKNFIEDFSKSNEASWVYMPIDTRINQFIFSNNYGTHDKFSDEIWEELINTFWEKVVLKY